ncbi:uncharacterized protein NECHADRAFT_78481 [Fusarium vanettenii 77-13-4]|uniref:Fungal-specific transcription factor domain-containing protein n=1 Tax=Fusarium vanettenii (strain ATCC MYA-4622 / CBS 123669 / FGSC 9596 / NRRL 45880 / 77-13-4) TaxID=660122 RepID=C7ZFE6_FUSV7|nr:uncharacterized protein NECHADRAFT_78481 [Fusarium vanettenii 77-13-4]EEU37232.1 hypothetical protein NECHADRAFT_78481 [Fusarium vanettenii 77-13-4]
MPGVAATHSLLTVVTKGDNCEGYPLKFCGVASRGKLSGKPHPFADTSPRPVKKRRVRAQSTTGSTEAVAPTSTPRDVRPSPPETTTVTAVSPPTGPTLAISPVGAVVDPNPLDQDATITMPGGAMLPGSPEFDWSSREAFMEMASILRESALEDQITGVSPATSTLSRDDELLLPLDAICGTTEAEGQRILVGMNKFSLSSSGNVQEDAVAASLAASFSRIPWASRIAAVKFDALPSLSSPLDKTPFPTNLDQDRVQFLLQYFDETVCPKLVIDGAAAWSNPFQQYLLPMSLQFSGVLYAVLGLSLGHLSINHCDNPFNEQESLQYRFRAIRQVIDWLEGLQGTSTDPCLVEAGLAIILILLIHDVCETGVSAGGIHLNGVTSICQRHSKLLERSIRDRPCMKFLFGALSWRYEELLTDGVQEHVFQEMDDRLFECFSGCPLELFLAFSRLLKLSKDELMTTSGTSPDKADMESIRSIQQYLATWKRDTNSDAAPEDGSDHLANAFRHSFLLHSLRFSDKDMTADNSEIQRHIQEILNAVSKVPTGFKGSSRLLWPLFMAGTESLMAYQQDYVLLRVKAILNDTGFRNLASTTILEHIWKERRKGAESGSDTRLWTDYLSKKDIMETHDYLIF